MEDLSYWEVAYNNFMEKQHGNKSIKPSANVVMAKMTAKGVLFWLLVVLILFLIFWVIQGSVF